MTDPKPEDIKRSGFVALIGAPNAGKSCLVNALCGTKISIVSPKVQTTRTRVLGIMTEGDAQAVFVDTPGIFQPRRRLDRAMVAAAHEARDDADIVALIADASRKDCLQTIGKLLGRMHTEGRTIALVLNKIDLIDRKKLLPLLATLSTKYDFAATFLISATRSDGVKDMLNWVLKTLPEGPCLYDPEIAGDMPERVLAAEITREKLFLRLHEELPYGVHVETVNFEDYDNGSVKIDQVIVLSEKRHKGMVIGKDGSMLKLVGGLARTELEALFERRVHLFLDVIVREGWDEKSETISEMGLDPNA